MHDMGVALDGEALGDTDRTGLGDAADVVPAQVEEHQMFRAFLLIGEQFHGQRLVFFDAGAAPARAGDGAQGELHLPGLFLQAHQDLGRGTDDMEVAKIEIEHVGRRVECAQRSVERQRTRREGFAHALGEHHLHDVAGDDVFLGAAHRGLEGGLAEFRDGGGGRRRYTFRNLHRFAQPGEQFLQARLGLFPGAGKAGLGIDH